MNQIIKGDVMAKKPKSKKVNKKQGVRAKILMANTPNNQANMAREVRILKTSKSVTSTGWPELMCTTKSPEPTTSNKPPKLRTVIRLNPMTEDKLWCWCSCEFFLFRLEYALTTYGASVIINGNGEPAVMMNPNNRPYLCLSGDTLVRTEQGHKRLEEIQEGDKVLTLSGSSYVTHHQMTGEKKVTYVRTQYGSEIKGSDTHPVLTFNKSTLDFEWKNIKDLRVGDQMVQVLSQQKMKGEKNPKSLRELHVAKLLGYMISEGYDKTFSQQPGKVMDDFVFRCKKVFGREPRIDGSDTQAAILLTEDARFLKSYGGFGNNSYEHYIPPFIWTAPEPIVNSFLTGLYNGDGHTAHNVNTTCYATVSKRLAQELRELLASRGIRTTISKNISGVNDSLMYLVRSSDYISSKRLLNKIKKGVKYRELSVKRTLPNIATQVDSQSVYNKIVDEIFDEYTVDDKLVPIRDALEHFEFVNAQAESWVSRVVKTLPEVGKIDNYPYKAIKACSTRQLKEHFDYHIKENIKKIYFNSARSKIPNVKNKLKASLEFDVAGGKQVEDWLGLMLREDIVLESITEIERTNETVKMYDITVDHDEHFIANGMVVHNCKHLYAVMKKKNALKVLQNMLDDE